MQLESLWIEKTIPIGDVDRLLKDGWEIEVDSPDGMVPVNFFVDKGMYDEYVLTMNDYSMRRIRCNGDHLFETTIGWAAASQIVDKEVDFLCKNGEYKKGVVTMTGQRIPIVDINVEHENHRYYTEEVSSHNTGVGKSMFMCHSAASALKMGHDVLYITAEMAEIKIAERIDANLFNVPLNDIENMSRDMFISKVDKIKAKTQGRLVIKEYPTGSCHVGHFRHLLNELKHKQNMKPDVIFVDYLNICASARMKNNGNVNSYTLVKSIAEELRGLAIEFDVPVITATQTNREGYGNSDVDLTNVSESFGLPATADLMFALIATDELKRMNQVVVKQLKNRYSDPGDMPKFNLGVDRAKMKFFDCDQPTAGLSSEPRGKASDNIDVFVPGKAPASDFGSFNF